MPPVPGWYSDPGDGAQVRFWDGQGWTAQTAPLHAGAGIAAPAQQVGYFDTPTYSARPPVYAQPPIYAQPPTYGEPLPGSYAYALQDSARRQGGSSVALKILIGLGIGFFALVALAIAIPVFVSQSPDDLYRRTTIVTPPSMVGMTKQDNAISQDLATNYDTYLPSSWPHASGVYARADGGPGAVIGIAKHVNGTAQLTAVQAEVERGFRNSLSSASSVGQFSEIAAGKLGGKFACATVAFRSVPGTVCVFADRAVAGVIITYEPNDESVALGIRSAIELRH